MDSNRGDQTESQKLCGRWVEEGLAKKNQNTETEVQQQNEKLIKEVADYIAKC